MIPVEWRFSFVYIFSIISSEVKTVSCFCLFFPLFNAVSTSCNWVRMSGLSIQYFHIVNDPTHVSFDPDKDKLFWSEPTPVDLAWTKNINLGNIEQSIKSWGQEPGTKQVFANCQRHLKKMKPNRHHREKIRGDSVLYSQLGKLLVFFFSRIRNSSSVKWPNCLLCQNLL